MQDNVSAMSTSPGAVAVPPAVAIMQPTFAPWLGYFDLLDRTDVFVLLDDVQLSRQSFQTRNRIQGTSPEPRWLPVPHDHASPVAERIIATTAVRDPQAAGERIVNVLSSFYRGSPHLGLVSDLVREAFAHRTLGGVNISLINGVAACLGIGTRTVSASTLGVSDRRSGKVRGVLDAVGWGTYVTVPGSVDYMIEDGLFADVSDRVLVEAFEPIPYPQRGDRAFTGHLSVLDALLEVGPEATMEVVRAGRRPLIPLAIASARSDAPQE